MNLHTDSFTRNTAAVARKAALEDDNIRVSAAQLVKICSRIAEQSAARDFLGTSDGIAFVNCVYSMTGVDALYDLKCDLEHEFAADLTRERAVLASVGSEQ